VPLWGAEAGAGSAVEIDQQVLAASWISSAVMASLANSNERAKQESFTIPSRIFPGRTCDANHDAPCMKNPGCTKSMADAD
jgi:hypothetical protein